MKASSLEVLGLVAKSETRKTGFAIQRFVELLDSTTPFFYSVHLSISPQESVREALDLLQMYQDKPSFVNYHLIACLRRTHKLLKTDSLIQENFESTQKLKTHLAGFLKELDAIPKSKNNEINRRTEFILDQTDTLEQYLEQSLLEMGSEYIKCAFEKLKRAINSRYEEAKQYKHIDRALIAISRNLVDAGRTPRKTLETFSKSFEKFSVIKPQDFLTILIQLLREKQRDYEVTVVLDGISNINLAKLPREIQGSVKTLRKGKEQWFSQADEGKLKKFCEQHWGKIKKPRAKRAQAKAFRCVIMVVKVRAWDQDGAREKALVMADQIVDLVNVANRGKRIGVKRKVLVLDLLTGKQFNNNGDTRVHEQLEPMVLDSYSAISNSLRFASRLKTERSKTVSVLFAWIALESFFSGSSNAQGKVITNIALLGSRAASRGIVSYCRTMLRVEIQNMQDTYSSDHKSHELRELRGLDLFDFHQYLLGSTVEAEDLKPSLSPLAHWRFKEAATRLRTGDSIQAYVVEITEKLEWALTRMAHYRNQTVHSARTENTAETSLAPLSAEIIDFSLEVVSILDKKQPANFQLALESYTEKIRKQIDEWGRDGRSSPKLLGEQDASEYRVLEYTDEAP